MQRSTDRHRPRLPRLARSTRRWLLLATAVAVAALIVGVVTAPPGVPAATRERVPPGSAGESPCTTTPAGAYADALARRLTSVEAGARAVWLCNTNDLGPQVPADALSSRLDELAALINSLPELPPDASCTAELGPHFALLFYYPDGTRSVIAGQLDGCRVIAGRMGAQRIIDTYLAWLLDQRRTQPAPSVTAALTNP